MLTFLLEVILVIVASLLIGAGISAILESCWDKQNKWEERYEDKE